MDSEKLIELVRGYSFLYDQEDKSYSDSTKKDAAWKEIGNILNKPTKDCKQKWGNLRDCFRRFLKKKRCTTSGQAACKNKKWKYGEEMPFLLPYFQERETVTTVPSEYVQDVHENVQDVEEEREEGQGELENSIRETPTSDRREPSRRPSASSILMEYVLNIKDTPSNEEPDETDLFYKSMALSIKKLTPYSQIMIRNRMTDLLSQFQLEELTRVENRDSSSMPRPRPDSRGSNE